MRLPTFAIALVVLVSCAGRMQPPTIDALYVGQGNPVARPDTAIVETFLASAPPDREYAVIGQVTVSTERASRPVQEMLEWAKMAARGIGGYGLVNIQYSIGPETVTGATTVPIRNLVTGEEIGASTRTQTSQTRVLVADIIIWIGPPPPYARISRFLP